MLEILNLVPVLQYICTTNAVTLVSAMLTLHCIQNQLMEMSNGGIMLVHMLLMGCSRGERQWGSYALPFASTFRISLLSGLFSEHVWER